MTSLELWTHCIRIRLHKSSTGHRRDRDGEHDEDRTDPSKARTVPGFGFHAPHPRHLVVPLWSACYACFLILYNKGVSSTFEHSVRSRALDSEPDQQSPTSVALRLLGAIGAVGLVGAGSVFAWILLGKAMAWAAVALFGPLVALEVVGLPLLRRRVRDSLLLRTLTDGLVKVAVYTLALQAAFFMTLAMIAVSMITGGGSSATSPAAYAYEFMITASLVFVFLFGFGGLGTVGMNLATYDEPQWRLAHRLAGWFVILMAVAVLFPGLLYLPRWLEALGTKIGPTRAGLVVLGAMGLMSLVMTHAFLIWVTPGISSLHLHGPTGLTAVTKKRETSVWDLEGNQVFKETIGRSVVLFNQDGTLLAADDGNGAVWIWQVPDATVASKIEGLKNDLESIAFSPESRRLATLDEDGFLQVRALPEGRLEWETDCAKTANDPRWVAFDPSGAVLLVGTGQAKLLRYESSGCRLLGSPTDFVADFDAEGFAQVRLSPSGHSLVLSETSKATAFRIDGASLTRGAQGGADGAILVLSACDDRAETLAVGHENNIHVHFRSKPSFKLDVGSEKIQTLSMDGAGRRLATASKKHIAIWDLETKQQTRLA